MKLETKNGEIIIQTRCLNLVLDESGELAQIRTPDGDYSIQVSYGELIVNGFNLEELLKEGRARLKRR